MNLVDTLNLLKICVNCDYQYMGIVLSSAVRNFSDIGPKILLAPVSDLDTGIQYVGTAATIAEKRQRIATLVAFLAASAVAVTTDPIIGGEVASKIAYMEVILARGGGNIAKSIFSTSLKELEIIVDSVKIPVLDIHLYRTEFTRNNKMIIHHMFREHTARLYL